MNSDHTENLNKELFETILSLKNVEECKDFFEDLCTYKEVEQMAQRVKAAKLLIEGKTYIEVTDATDISTATLARVSKCLHHGSGGYEKILKR